MRVKELKAEIAAEEQRLELAKKNNADFLSKMTAVYDAQKKILVKLAAAPELQPTEPRDEDDTAMSIPTLSADIQEAVAPQTSVQADDKMPHVPRNEELPADAKQYVEVQKEKKFTISEINLASSKQQQAQQQQALATDTQRLHEQATARFDFGELKFGADYKPEND